MSDNFDTTLPIRDDLRRDLIFGVEARLPIANILSYSGYQHQVMPLMQNISHTTRVYVINANGLPGFVQTFDIAKHLKAADEAGQLKRARMYQLINMDTVKEKLDAIATRLLKMDLLSREYPSLFVFILEYFDM